MAIDVTAANLGQEIQRAREAFVDKSREEPAHWWTARELRAAAKNGWSSGAANLALGRLIEDGTFDLKDGRVRLSQIPPE